MTPAIAVVGMACRYADALSPAELWQNAVAQRRAFRRMPAERLRLEDYISTNGEGSDFIYLTEAAVIEGYEFDRVKFRVAGGTFRSADLAHWLALDVAAQALADAGFTDPDQIPREMTGVILGNTLTGEFSRASTMRLRWPYVRRVLDALLIKQKWSDEKRLEFLKQLEADYKRPFPPPGEESLAGGLSNTIAGRICNHFDLKGGGYTVDGACASSLLAVTTACSILAAGDLDLVLAGGVDLSMDPFELVGFAKLAALAREEMRVYDARSGGFWPGEGCGFVTLMRQEEAIAQGRQIYALIRGWGVSSDGNGGITRPEVEGQMLALKRAYGKAGFGIETVPYFEGHGTGTSVGDATELRAISRARSEALCDGAPAYIGSIKANIGHTKAAAGVAGLIKATMALHTQILPPTTGCREPHAELRGEKSALQVLDQARAWPSERPLRAGVSAMGFGGINTHIVLEKLPNQRRKRLGAHESAIAASAQDAELFLFAAGDGSELRRQVEHLLTFAACVSLAELSDLAALLERSLEHHQTRAAIIASTPQELMRGLETLKTWLAEGKEAQLDLRAGVFLGRAAAAPGIGFLFPGQGSPTHLDGGLFKRRFEFVRDLYAEANLPASSHTSTRTAQPAIMLATVAALRLLERLGINAQVGVGHSLGELAAIHWAEGLGEESLLRIAAARGRIMAELGDPTGAMASIQASRGEVESLLNGDRVVIAGLNSPRQTVIAGEMAAVDAVVARSRDSGIGAVRLQVSHAFHSPLVERAAPIFKEYLDQETIFPLQRKVVSTVTGAVLTPESDLKALLNQQITSPVRFEEAVTRAARSVALFIEVGPGETLSRLVKDFIAVPAIALDSGGPSIKGLLRATGAAYVLGAPVNPAALFAGRFTKRFNLNWKPRFFINPCELAPLPDPLTQIAVSEPAPAKLLTRSDDYVIEPVAAEAPVATTQEAPPILSLARQLVAHHAELPEAVIKDEHRLLGDLHLNSITVSQIVTEIARRAGLKRPFSPTNYAEATVAELAQAMEQLAKADEQADVEKENRPPTGIDSWVRAFTTEMVERPLPRRQPQAAPVARAVFYAKGHQFGDLLRNHLGETEGGDTVVVCLPPCPDEQHISLLLAAARAALDSPQVSRFVLVQHGGGASAFAKTLYLENPQLTTCVIDIPSEERAIEWVKAEMRAATGYSEAHYDTSGRRQEPVLRTLDISGTDEEIPLGPADVLLVTGGGKGITAECALSIARQTGAALVLIGLSQPDSDAELANNLNRMAAAGVRFKYFAADVTNAEAVAAAVSQVKAFGPITAILHGAAINVPQLLRAMTDEQFLHTVATKLQGARNLLAAIDVSRLKLFVAFSSIIGRTGLPGEAHYGLANEWLTRLTEELQARAAGAKCMAIEWSVWSGVGMAQRIGGVERLVESGITPITPDEGVAMLGRLLRTKLAATAVVVTGRYGELPTIKIARPELPMLRFLERPRIYYPQIELIADAELSAEADFYLADHAFQGERLLPAVIGLEAMAQVAMAVTGSTELPCFEKVEFARPVIVPHGQSLMIRVAALVREPGRVDVVLRSQETAFQFDHFRASCSFRREAARSEPNEPQLSDDWMKSPLLPINPEEDLYGGILFHRGRFRRLRGYHHLRAKECFAQIKPDDSASWFVHYLPSTLLLGDPGARDTAIHSVQACIPHMTLLPIGVERITTNTFSTTGTKFVHARERARQGDTFIYDLEVIGEGREVLERWSGLKLRVVNNGNVQSTWVEPLLAPYIERRMSELVPALSLNVAVNHGSRSGRRERSDRAIRQATGKAAPVTRRGNGKVGLLDPEQVAAHCGRLALAIAGQGVVACDIEEIKPHSTAIWRDRLGPDRIALAEIISRETGDDLDTAATRVWTASECLKRAGVLAVAPLTFSSATDDGWTLLSTGHLTIATYKTETRNSRGHFVIGLLTSNQA